MRVTLRQLSSFSAVVVHGSYTKAAEELFLSQPAVSQHIKQLEDNLGIPLFDGVGKRLQLTPAGEELFRYAQAVQEQLQEAQEVIDGLKGLKGGRLSVTVASAANHFASRILAAFAKQHPGTELTLDVTNRGQILRQLEENSRDMVIMGRPPKHRDLDATPFVENPLVVIAERDHPLCREHSIPINVLAHETFVVRERDSGTRTALEEMFRTNGLTLTKGMEITQNEAIKQSVEAGLGLGVVSLHTLELELETERVKVLDVEGFPIRRHWYVVHRRGKRLSPLAAAFKSFVLERGPSCAQLPDY